MKKEIDIGTVEKPEIREIETWVVEQNCVRVPYTVGYPGSSWLATAVANRAAKTGGIDRTFWERGQSGYAIVPSNLSAGDYVENGTKDKKGRRSNYYYRVLVVTEENLIVREAGNPLVNLKPIERELELAEIVPAVVRTVEDLAVEELAKYTTEQLQAEINRRLS